MCAVIFAVMSVFVLPDFCVIIRDRMGWRKLFN